MGIAIASGLEMFVFLVRAVSIEERLQTLALILILPISTLKTKVGELQVQRKTVMLT